MKLFRKILFAAFMVMTVAVAVPTADVAAADCSTGGHFLGLRAWYDGLMEGEGKDATCKIREPKNEDEARAFVWTIIFNVASLIMGVAGYAAIGFVIWGGIQYMLAQGDPGKVAKGKKTITNSIIGIIIVSSASIISGMVSDIINGAYNSQVANQGGAEFFKNILNHVFLWSGIIAVIMVVYGGIQYAMSAGNPQAVAKAKTTIMYSLIGLAVVIMGAGIVAMVVNNL